MNMPTLQPMRYIHWEWYSIYICACGDRYHNDNSDIKECHEWFEKHEPHCSPPIPQEAMPV
jgi:hypothetical protein